MQWLNTFANEIVMNNGMGMDIMLGMLTLMVYFVCSTSMLFFFIDTASEDGFWKPEYRGKSHGFVGCRFVSVPAMDCLNRYCILLVFMEL